MPSVVIAWHSGYGHTRKLAEALDEGAASVPGVRAQSIDVAAIDAAGWEALGAADAIVFGAPTYMGGPSAPFKGFADATAKIWLTQGWRDKLAGGFTCSLAMSGDKASTLNYFVTLAMQHGMIWVGLGILQASQAGAPDAVNRIGSYTGVMAQADNVPPDESPPQGDLDTAYAYGRRIATFAKRLRGSVA
ncbi:MAG: flavodoxin family protein [Burkholderiales bacterium]|nr:MAG: flavodoxin family protein [Burkholderiales bacterium]